MADETGSGVRNRQGVAAAWGFLAFVIAVVALFLALHARARANQAYQQTQITNERLTKLNAHVDNALGKQSTTGNAANAASTTGGNTSVPTANGQ